MNKALTLTAVQAADALGGSRTVGLACIGWTHLARQMTSFDAGYRAMASDQAREAQAREWSNALAEVRPRQRQRNPQDAPGVGAIAPIARPA